MKRIFKILSTSFLLASSFGAIALANKEAKVESKEVSATTISVSNYSDFKDALVGATASTEIIVTNSITIPDGEALDGNGATVRVETPYLDEHGYVNHSATNLDYIFSIEQNSTVTMENMVIMGGASDILYAAIWVDQGATLGLRNVHVTRSNRGISVWGGTLLLLDCDITRNAASYGGGILCRRGFSSPSVPGKVIMDRCSLSENRSTGDMCGGGAIEVNSDSALYANNTIIANNSSSEIGGAINSYNGYVNLINCTVTGNVTTAGLSFGGGVGVNSSHPFYAVNCIATDNYYYDIENNTLTQSDVGFYVSTARGYFYNSISSNYLWVNEGNPSEIVNYDASTCVIDTTSQTASYYRSDGVIYSLDGVETMTPNYSHPGLLSKNNRKSALYVPVSQTGPANGGGVETYFDYSDLDDVKMGFGPSGSINTFVGSTPVSSSYLVDTFYEGVSRSPGVIGACAPGSGIYHTVTLGSNEHGTVEGATIYGDSYLGSSAVTLTATPVAGYAFDHWELEGATTTSVSSNPYTFSVEEDLTVNAIYVPYVNLTFNLNGGSGTAPSSSYLPGGSEIIVPNNSGFSRANCKFVCWNTQADGLGTDYYPADRYVLGSSDAVLYAKWELPTSLNASYSNYVVVGNKINAAYLSISAVFNNSSSEPVNPLSVSYYVDSVLIADPVNYVFDSIKTYTIEIRYLGLSTTFDVEVVSESHSFSYDTNGGSGTLPSSSSHHSGETIVVQNANGISKTNCRFICWNTQADGLGTNYYPGDLFTMGVDTAVLYAKWELPATLTATYSGELTRTGKIDKSKLSVFVTFADSSSEPVNIASPEYRVDSSLVDFDTYNFNTSKTYDVVVSYLGLTAHLNVLVNPITYTVSFNATEGSGTQDSVAVNEGSLFELPSTSFIAPEHKHFVGWSYTSGGDVIEGSSIAVNNNVALYAKWAEDEFVVSFVSGEAASGSVAPTTETYNAEYTLPEASTFTAPEGKFFIGYEVSGEDELMQPGETIHVTRGLVIKPIFEKISLASISLSGVQKTSFTVGDEFVIDGLSVIASYNDGSSHAVTNFIVSGYNMSKEGTQTIIVSYIEDDIAKSASYEITIKAKGDVAPDEQPEEQTSEQQAQSSEVNPFLIMAIVLGALLFLSILMFPLAVSRANSKNDFPRYPRYPRY